MRADASQRNPCCSATQAPTEHSHPGDPVAVMAGKFRAQLREVASTTNATTRNVIGQQVADASNELLQRLPRNQL